MKVSAQKKSKTAATPAVQAANQPFFKKAGEENYFSPARPAIVPVVKPDVTVHRPIEKFGREPNRIQHRNVKAPAPPKAARERQRDNRLQKKDEEDIREIPAAEEEPRRTDNEGTPGEDKGGELSHPAETKTPAARPDRSPEQIAGAGKTSEDNRPARPAIGLADSGTPGSEQKNEDEGIAGPAPPALETPAGGKAANNGDLSSLSGRIAAAPQSTAKVQAIAQAQLINSDCMRSEAQVSQIASARRLQTGAYFSGLRLRLAGFLLQSAIGVQMLIAVRQAELISAVSRALVWARTAIMGVMQAAQALSAQIRVRINQMLENIKASVQGRVRGIAGQITGLINSVPLPDIPGISQIRAAAVNMLNRAAEVVNGTFARFVGFVGWALNAGMNILDLLLTGFTRVVGMLLSLASAAILGILQLISRALSRAMSRIISALQGAFMRVVIPVLNLIERLINRLISRAEKIALTLLRANRLRSLAALAEFFAPCAATPRPAGESDEGRIERIQQVGRDALLLNRLIVQTFLLLMGGLITAIVRTIATIVARIFAVIAGLIAQAVAKILAAFVQAIQMLNQLIQIVGSFFQELFSALTQTVMKLVTTLISLVQRGVERLIQFIQDAMRRMIGFIRRFVENLILGRGLVESLRDALGEFVISHGPITRPRPGPITIPGILIGIVVILASIGALIVYAFPELLVIVAWLVSLGLSPMAAFAVLAVVAISLLLLLLLLLFLLIRWLTKPCPPKPPKPIVPVTISGGTELWHFNGAAPPTYPVKQTLVASAGGVSGIFWWTITSGRLYAGFGLLPVAVGSTVTLHSKRESAARDDVEVRVKFFGFRGARGETTRKFTVQAPDRLGRLGNTDLSDATWGYETRINYNIKDQFGTVMPRNVPINEQWTGGVVADFSGMNWRRHNNKAIMGTIVNPAGWFDRVQGEDAGRTPAPVGPTHADASVAVYHWPGRWRVGSTNSGDGRRVDDVTWRKFRGRAQHT